MTSTLKKAHPRRKVSGTLFQEFGYIRSPTSLYHSKLTNISRSGIQNMFAPVYKQRWVAPKIADKWTVQGNKRVDTKIWPVRLL